MPVIDLDARVTAALVDGLSRGEVWTAYTHVEELDEPERSARLRGLLSEEEQARQLRFHFVHDRHSYLAAHALTRSLLAAVLRVPPLELRFEAGPHGRPELVAPQRVPPLRFNLSHTRGMVACALAFEVDVGVDVEQVTRRIEIAQLARQVFSQRERGALLELPEEARRERFFRLWTLKEAYIKAVGDGLAIPLRSVSFEVDAVVAPRIEFAAPIVDDAGAWHFENWWPVANHMLAVAVRSHRPPTLRLIELRV